MRDRCNRCKTAPLCFLLLLLLLITGVAHAADCGNGIAICGCGDRVVSDYTLTGDLICPASFTGYALTLGADGITIDGQGLYKVEASGAVAVIQNRLHSGWTLQNIAIKGGLFGIQSDARPLPNGAQGISILNVDASSPQHGQCIRFLDTHQSRVESSRADGGTIGIYNLNGDGNSYVGTSASWLASYGPRPPGQSVGVELIGVRDNLLESITATNRQIGVVIVADTANPNWGARTSDRNIVRDSDISGNKQGISFAFEGDGNQFLRNDLSRSTDIALAVNGDSGVVIEGNTYLDSFNGINLSNLDTQGRTVIADVDLTTISGTYGLRIHGVGNSRFERIEIGEGARQSLWWSGGSTGNTFHQIVALGHTFGLLSQDAHDNLVTDSDFSWTGGERQATGIDLRLGSTGNVFDNITVHQRIFGAQTFGEGGGTAIQNSDLSDNHNCIFAQANNPVAHQKLTNLKLNGCTGNALGVAFDNLIELRDIDFAGSSVGLVLIAMGGINLDGQAQGLELSDVIHSGLSLIDVDDSIFTHVSVGGELRGVSLTTSDRNVFSGIDASWTGPTPSGDGFFLDRSTENTIRDSTVENRANGLQILSGSDDNVFQCNSLTNNVMGAVNNFGASGNRFNSSVIAENSDFGVRNTDASLVDATLNYWGAVDGPSPPGSGDAVSGTVNVTPFSSVSGDLNALCGRAEVPRGLKEQAVELLEAVLPTGDQRADGQIRKAIDHIRDSLAAELWVDDEHLVKHDGEDVFKAERKAVRKLLKVLDEGPAQATEDAAIQAIANLLLADQLLAETAVAEAVAAADVTGCEATDDSDGDSNSDGGSDNDGEHEDDGPECDCGQALSNLTRAQAELTHAQDEIDAGRFAEAINRYWRAWEGAMSTLCAVAGCGL